ncbi:MAG TPA: cytochrome c oxidase subunit II [Chromatiales bacterium]|nr:cytochrome c oxidase subunit II [Chromatiales bacterium]
MWREPGNKQVLEPEIIIIEPVDTGLTKVRKTAIDLIRKALAAILLTGGAAHAGEINMPVGVTDISHEVFDLHMLIFWVCVAIAVVVFSVMIYSIVKFRHSKGAVPAQFSHSTKAEIIWTVIPVLILVSLAIPTARTIIQIEDTRDSELTIRITGYQWKWRYDYMDKDVGFFSNLAQASNEARQLNSGIDPKTVDNYLLDADRPLVVPVGVKIRYLITSNDVIHSWWMPQFAIKKDAIPGFINEGWFKVNEPGTYRGQCAELCGKDHGFMPIVVRAVPPDEFAVWLASQQDQTAVAQSGAARQAL